MPAPQILVVPGGAIYLRSVTGYNISNHRFEIRGLATAREWDSGNYGHLGIWLLNQWGKLIRSATANYGYLEHFRARPSPTHFGVLIDRVPEHVSTAVIAYQRGLASAVSHAHMFNIWHQLRSLLFHSTWAQGSIGGTSGAQRFRSLD